MSYIKHQEHLFIPSPKKRAFKKKTMGKLRSAGLYSDPRSWSFDPKRRREHFIESLNNLSSSSSSENILKEVTKMFKKSKKYRHKSGRSKDERKTKSEEDLVMETDQEYSSLESELGSVGCKMKSLKQENLKLKGDNQKITSEVDNLRTLVTDLKSQMDYLESIKVENAELKVHLNSSTHQDLIEANDQIDHLKREIQIYNSIKNKYGELRRENEKLQKDCRKMNVRIKELETQRNKLQDQLTVKEDELHSLLERSTEISTAAAEKKILRERIAIRDEKIKALNTELQEKELVANEFNEELKKHEAYFHQKEESLVAQIDSLKVILEEKSEKISELENKLQNTELLVTQLEMLRDQLRLSNSQLKENVNTYKRQFEKAVESSERIAGSIKKLQEDVEAKEEQINKLSLFPQSATTMVCFAHLHKLVTEAETIDCNSIAQMKDLMENIRTIVTQVKREMWGKHTMPPSLLIQDSQCQANAERGDGWTQCCTDVEDKTIQSDLPPEYQEKYIEAEQLINKLSSTISTLEDNIKEKDEEYDSIETQYINLLDENSEKELEIAKLLENKRTLETELGAVNEELQSSGLLLDRAVIEIDTLMQTNESARDLLENALQSTMDEYNNYIKVLETFLDYKEDKINSLSQLIETEGVQNESKVKELEGLMSAMNEELQKERSLSSDLGNEVTSLLQIISEKTNQLNEMEDKLSTMEVSQTKINSETDSVISFHFETCKETMIQQQMMQDQLLKKLNQEETANRSLKKILKQGNCKKREMIKKMFSVSQKLHRSRRVIRNLNEKLKTGELSNSSNDSILQSEKASLVDQIDFLKAKILDLESSLKVHEDKNIYHEEFKMQMEKVALKQMKRLTKYKLLLNKEKENKQTMTMCDADERDLSNIIDYLKEENNKLSQTIQTLKSQLSVLINSTFLEKQSTGSQASLPDEIIQMEKENSAESIKSHYETIIDTLGKEHLIEKEQSQRQYANNLKMLKDCYERDMKALKKTHTENIVKIQAQHSEELESLIESHAKEIEDDKKRIALEMVHKEELEKLSNEYEIQLLERERCYLQEKEELAQKMSEIRIEYDSELSRINIESVTAIRGLKAKSKKLLRKVNDQHKAQLKLMDEKYKIEYDEQKMREKQEKDDSMVTKEIQCYNVQLVDNSSSTDISRNTDIGVNTDSPQKTTQKVLDISVQQSIQYEVKTDSETLMRLLPLMNGNGDQTDLVSNDMMQNEMRKLEQELSLVKQETSRRENLYEKKIKHEQMKSREVATLLDQELRYSTDVHIRLGLQFKRAERLEAEKEEMATKLALAEQKIKNLQSLLEKEKDRTMSMKKVLEKMKADPQESLQLEKSLNRLKDKIDQAVECEKRLTEDLRKEIPKTATEIVRAEKELSASVKDLKFVVIKQQDIKQTWSQRIDDVIN